MSKFDYSKRCGVDKHSKSGKRGFPPSRPQLLDPIYPNRRRQMVYVVPNTQTRLKIFFGKAMDSMILQTVLESVRSFCTFIILEDGDSWLPSNLDPYCRNGPYGGNVQMRSAHDQHLTYRILRSTMQGLLNVLVIGGEDYDVEVEVFDWDWILIGIGHVSETIRMANSTGVRGTEDLVTQCADAKTTSYSSGSRVAVEGLVAARRRGTRRVEGSVDGHLLYSHS